jgi:hypothetical protein
MPAIAGSRRQSPVTSWLLKALLCATSLGSNDSLEASQQQSVKEEGDSTAVSRTASKQFPSKQEVSTSCCIQGFFLLLAPAQQF